MRRREELHPKRMHTLGGVVAVLVLALGARAAAAQTFKSVDALSVVDANGKKVGTVLWAYPSGGGPTPEEYHVALEVNGLLFRLRTYGPHHLAGPWSAYILFESSDCSGTPYFSVDLIVQNDLLPLAVVGLPGRTAYLADPAATPRLIHPQSYSQSGTSYDPLLCQTGNPYPDAVTAIRALPLIDLLAEFTSPYRIVQASASGSVACCGDCNGNGQVAVDELVTAVNHALGECPAPSASQ